MKPIHGHTWLTKVSGRRKVNHDVNSEQDQGQSSPWEAKGENDTQQKRAIRWEKSPGS